jgi:DNA-binding LacI/PurR family transcriptional regulator
LSLGKTWQIGVVLPYLTLPSYVERLRGVQQTIGSTEYYPILYSVGSPEQRDEYLALLSEKTQVDGLLIISMPLSRPQRDKILTNQIPTVLIDASDSALNHIVVDDIAGGQMATAHLIELGHRRIAFLCDTLDTPFQSSGKDRYLGYRHALQNAGIPYRQEYVLESERGLEEARQAARRLLCLEPAPTAVFASCDTKAIGVLEAARDLGLQVPDDLSVIGYDNIRDASYLNLTTIGQPLYQSGVKGTRLLLDLIHGDLQDTRGIELPVRLVTRKTTGRCRDRKES